MVARLAELFLSQAIREYVEQLPASSKGWLRGLTDPAVSKALSIIHNRYAEDFDVETLAREAGVSRTVLGERFGELLGESPMRYCARWRMRMASQHAARREAEHGQHRACSRLQQRGSLQPRVQARIWRSRRRPGGSASRQRKRRSPERNEHRELPPQKVLYCTAKDGTRLAYSVVGEGPPIVKTANWLNHIQHDWDSPLWRHWIEELTSGRSLIRYDERGNGLSDWDTPDLSFEAFVQDLECVADCTELEQFDLLAISQGAAVAVAYAVRHPAAFGGWSSSMAMRRAGRCVPTRRKLPGARRC